MNAFARAMAFDTPCFEYVRILTRMLHDEPAITSAISTLQNHCLRHGVMLKWGDTPPTPSFQRHIREYYEPFCMDAILSFVAVGFAPFRLRREGAHTVPEVLPIGTYTWSVARSQQAKRQREDGSSVPREVPMHNPPLLRYDVVCSHCDDAIYVFNYQTPHPHLTCNSALASLMTQFLALEVLRKRANTAEVLPRRHSFVIRHARQPLTDTHRWGGGRSGTRTPTCRSRTPTPRTASTTRCRTAAA